MGRDGRGRKSNEAKHQGRALDLLMVVCEAGDIIFEALRFLLSLWLNDI
jgi:hypothetical protein